MNALHQSLTHIQAFQKSSLTSEIAGMEFALQGLDKEAASSLCLRMDVTPVLLQSAVSLKKAASQINVIIHTVGILVSLPFILEEGEKIEAVSLGAGNTGKPFDLETDRRIAEFKFIHWQGGSETIRQNALFKDFYLLAESQSQKRKFLYVVDSKYPLKFFGAGRAIKSVFSRLPVLMDDIRTRYADRFPTVREYYNHRRDSVAVIDLKSVVPPFANGFDLAGVEDETNEP
jgi:hypothetical protein